MLLRSVEAPTPNPQLTVLPAREAVRVEVVAVSVPAVEIPNVAEDCPAGIVTLAGTVTSELVEFRLMTRSVGAAVLRVTVPVEDAPPVTDPGDAEML